MSAPQKTGVRKTSDASANPGAGSGRVIDFSLPLNPLGPPPAVVRALANLDPSLTVDSPYFELREALGARLTVPKTKVWVSGSVTELVSLLARATLHPRQRALLFRPGPSEYVEAVLLAGGEVVEAASTARKDWRWELRAVREILRGVRPEMACIGSPNDPTGAYLASEEVESLARAVFPAPLLVDESFVAFADAPWESTSLVNEHPNLVILRSPTVDYALAGMSLAYCVAHEEIVERLRRLQEPRSVKAAAQIACLAALEEATHLAAARALVRQGKSVLHEGLHGLGVRTGADQANFVLARTGRATAVCQTLLAQGLRVADCTPYGLPNHVRIAVRSPSQCQLLVEALGQVIPQV